MNVLFKELNSNHEITVYDTPVLYGERGNFRVLQFSNGAVQGALDLANPGRVMLEYPRAIIHLMEYNHPSFNDVFVIGHGIGTIAGHFPLKRFTSAELDPQVVEVSRRYFGYQGSDVIVGDGRIVLGGKESRIYDYIVLDAFTSKGTPRHLISKEFFALAAGKLNAEGYLLINAIGKGEQDALINAIHTTLGEVFPCVQSFALPPADSHDMQNILLMAGNASVQYQARHMAGFKEIRLGAGYVLWDR